MKIIGGVDDNQNSNPNPMGSNEYSINNFEDEFAAITNPFSEMALSPQSLHVRYSSKLSPSTKMKSQIKNSSILIANISPKPKVPFSAKKNSNSSSPRSPHAFLELLLVVSYLLVEKRTSLNSIEWFLRIEEQILCPSLSTS